MYYILLLGIFLGVLWRLFMPYIRKVLAGELHWEDFNNEFVLKAIATLLYAVPLAAFIFFDAAINVPADLGMQLLVGLLYGFTAMNVTIGLPKWVAVAKQKLGLTGTENNPGPLDSDANPGEKEPGFWSKAADWAFGRNGGDPTRRVVARLELVVFVPVQFIFSSVLWGMAQAVMNQNWGVAGQYWGYVWKIGLISVLILWGRNGRTWISQYIGDWLGQRADEAARKAAQLARAASIEGHVKAIQEAAELVMHASAVLAGMRTPPSPDTPPVPPTPPAEG